MSEYKTRAELRLEELTKVTRPLTVDESDDLRRAMHAVYVRGNRLREHRAEELKLLKKVEREALMRSDLS